MVWPFSSVLWTIFVSFECLLWKHAPVHNIDFSLIATELELLQGQMPSCNASAVLINHKASKCSPLVTGTLKVFLRLHLDPCRAWNGYIYCLCSIVIRRGINTTIETTWRLSQILSANCRCVAKTVNVKWPVQQTVSAAAFWGIQAVSQLVIVWQLTKHRF